MNHDLVQGAIKAAIKTHVEQLLHQYDVHALLDTSEVGFNRCLDALPGVSEEQKVAYRPQLLQYWDTITAKNSHCTDCDHPLLDSLLCDSCKKCVCEVCWAMVPVDTYAAHADVCDRENLYPKATNKRSLEAIKKPSKRLAVKSEAVPTPVVPAPAVIVTPTEVYNEIEQGQGLPDIVCNAAWYQGCGTINPSTTRHCSHCNKNLWSNLNNYKERFYVGQSCAFFRYKTGVLEDGVVVSIAENGNDLIIKYAAVYTDFKYDEHHDINSVFHSKEKASERRGKRDRTATKAYQPVTTFVKTERKVEKAPLYEVKPGDPFVLCSPRWGGCGVKNPMSVYACHKCSKRLWTSKNKSNEFFHLGQVCIFLNRDVYEVEICEIVPSNDRHPSFPQVKVKYQGIYSADKYDEVVHIDQLSVDRQSINLGERRRIKPAVFEISDSHHSQSYTQLSENSLRYLDEQSSKRLQAQLHAQEEEELKFLRAYSKYTELDLEKLVYEFEVDDSVSEGNEDEEEQNTRKVKCECGGLFRRNCRDKHKLSSDRHILFIANIFSKLGTPYVCVCGKVVKTFAKLQQHLTSDRHLQYKTTFSEVVDEKSKEIPLDEDDLLENVESEETFEGLRFDKEKRILYKSSFVHDIPLFDLLVSLHFCSDNNDKFRLDRYRQKALVVELHDWLQRSTSTEMTLLELEELVLYFPMNVEELQQLTYARALIERNQDDEVLAALRAFSHSRQLNTHALSVIPIEVMKQIREGRLQSPPAGIPAEVDVIPESAYTLEMLRDMHLTLPLSFQQFRIIMNRVYETLGGRNNVEGAIGGLEAVTDGDKKYRAMYGGLTENFIQQLIEISRLNRYSKFLDVGSGINQISIQAAATVGCHCIGIEIESKRHEMAQCIIAKFDAILEEVGAIGRIGPLVQSRHGNFLEEGAAMSAATVILYNNYGPWFNAENPDKEMRTMQIGCQVFTLNPIIEEWLEQRTFSSGAYATTWCKNEMSMYWYSINTREWQCPNCNEMNQLGQEQCLSCGLKKRSHRIKDKNGNNRCNRS